MDNDKRGTRNFSVGITTIAVVFTVVCLTIFAVLSLSTASQEKKLAEKYADSVSAYWEADAECSGIVNAFGEIWAAGGVDADFDSLVSETGVTFYHDGDAIYVSFIRQINEATSLAVTFRMDDEFTVTGWQEMYTGDWEADLSLNVWGAE